MSGVSYWYVEGIISKTDKRIDVDHHKNGVTLASQRRLHCSYDLEHMGGGLYKLTAQIDGFITSSY